jgi:hypothetical protein
MAVMLPRMRNALQFRILRLQILNYTLSGFILIFILKTDLHTLEAGAKTAGAPYK